MSRSVVAAATLFVLAEAEVAAGGLGAGGAAVAAVATVPFALADRIPAAPFLAVGVLVPALGASWLEDANAAVFLLLAAAWLLGRAPLTVALPALAACLALAGGDDLGFLAVLVGLPWGCARAVRAYRERADRLRALAAALEDERAMSERLGVARERERMAREVHHAIAHAVGEMELQAAGAEQVLDDDPQRARSALGAVQDTGREAIARLRDALGILRAVDLPPDPPPAPAPRRSRPMLWLAILAFVMAAYAASGGGTLIALLPALAATYLAAAETEGRAAAAAAGLALVPAALEHTTDALLPLAFMTVPWLAGRAVARQRRRADELSTRAARLRGERDARMRLAALGERARVARELHDSVAHGVSVMVLQAGAAAETLGRDPELARSAIQAVQETGRTVLAELRTLVGEEPVHDLGGVAALVESARAAGLPVTLCEDGEATASAPHVDAAAYRIVQEALTNAIKHAGAPPTTVTISHRPDGVLVEVADHGPPVVAPAPGHGLAGMRERVTAHGGELHAGPRADGGFEVRAFLPSPGVPA